MPAYALKERQCARPAGSLRHAGDERDCTCDTSAYVSIRQLHTSAAYISQHTSAYVSLRHAGVARASAPVTSSECIREHT
jgi:hypothetical protein